MKNALKSVPKYHWLHLVIFLLEVACSKQKVTNIALDNAQICHRKPRTFYLLENDTLIAVAKNVDYFSPDHTRECYIKVAPVLKVKHVMKIIFDSFYFKSCDARLTLEESPHDVVGDEFSMMSNLSCGDNSPQVIRTSQVGNIVKISLTRKYDIRDFNFRLNIALVGGVAHFEDVSVGEKIGIAVICSVVGIILIILTIKTIRLRLDVKKDSSRSTALQLHETDTYRPVAHIGSSSQELDGNAENVPVTELIEDDDHAHHHTTLPDSTYVNTNDNPLSDSPPSYEEALDMPLPASREDSDTAVYQNIASVQPSSVVSENQT